MTVMVPQTLYGMQKDPVTVNDCFGSPLPYMECAGIIVTVNHCYSPPYLICECRNLVSVNHCYGPHTL